MKIAAKRLDGAHRKVEKRQTRGFALCIRIHLQVAKKRKRERERGRGAIGSEREGRTPIKSRQNARWKCGKKRKKSWGPIFGPFFFFFCCLHHVAFTSRWPKARAYSTRRKCNAIMFVFTNPNWLIVRFHIYRLQLLQYFCHIS